MDLITRGNFLTEGDMVMVTIFCPVETSIKVPIRMIWRMGMEHSSGQMDITTQEDGKKGLRLDMESISTKMATIIKEIFEKENSMELAIIPGQMVLSTLGT